MKVRIRKTQILKAAIKSHPESYVREDSWLLNEPDFIELEALPIEGEKGGKHMQNCHLICLCPPVAHTPKSESNYDRQVHLGKEARARLDEDTDKAFLEVLAPKTGECARDCYQRGCYSLINKPLCNCPCHQREEKCRFHPNGCVNDGIHADHPKKIEKLKLEFRGATHVNWPTENSLIQIEDKLNELIDAHNKQV